MPKKTKAQKIIAELRRKVAAQETTRSTLISPARKDSQEESLKEGRVKEPSQTLAYPETKNMEVLSSFVISDLKKSISLTVLAIALQFVLYYLLELDGFRNFSWIIDLIRKRV